eukprot:COSAG02_NODE_3846_length_6153_cov_1.953089_6_plen_52_part_00
MCVPRYAVVRARIIGDARVEQWRRDSVTAMSAPVLLLLQLLFARAASKGGG